MPNWVTNRIEFEASTEGEARHDKTLDYKTIDSPSFKEYCVAVGLQDAISEAPGTEKLKLVLDAKLFFDASLAHCYIDRWWEYYLYDKMRIL